MNRAEFNELLGLAVDERTFGDLVLYGTLIAKWNPRINLVSKATISDIWTRHIVDAAQLYPLIPSATGLRADLGSGGGLPGIVLALLSRQFASGVPQVLVESDQRKATFLREVIRQCGLAATVLSQRIEIVAPLGAAVVTARALAPLDKLLGLIAPHLSAEGVAILPKGGNAEAELEQAQAHWRFDLDSYPSITDPQARILRIKNLCRRPGVTA